LEIERIANAAREIAPIVRLLQHRKSLMLRFLKQFNVRTISGGKNDGDIRLEIHAEGGANVDLAVDVNESPRVDARCCRRRISISIDSAMFDLHCFCLFGRLRLRAQSEIESSSAVSRRGLRPDPAAVATNDSLHGRQADASALEIFLALKPLEDEIATLANKPEERKWDVPKRDID
jgi:hypothetical protein